MPEVPGKHILTSQITVQTRRAHVNEALAKAILRVCKANRSIIACYLLDTRKPDGDEIVLTIALTMDTQPSALESAAMEFQEMLKEFPEQAPKTYIMSSASFAKRYAGSEFYVRKNWWQIFG